MISKIKSRNCPQCNWKFPIAKVNTPIPRKNGTMFNCPQCHLPLVYKTSHEKLYIACSALIIPSSFYLADYKDVPIVRDIVTYILIPFFIVIAFFWRQGEYIEQYKP